MRNERRRTNKETARTSKNTKDGNLTLKQNGMKSPKKRKANKTDNTTGRNKLKDIEERMETEKITIQDQTIQDLPK